MEGNDGNAPHSEVRVEPLLMSVVLMHPRQLVHTCKKWGVESSYSREKGVRLGILTIGSMYI